MRTFISSFNIKDYTFRPDSYKNKEVIFIDFPYKLKLIEYLKEHTTARWTKERKLWYVPDNKYYRELFNLPDKHFSNNILKDIYSINKIALQNMVDQLELKGYSKNTIRVYTNEFVQLLKTIKGLNVDDLTAEKLRAYFLYCTKRLKLSESTIHSRMNAVNPVGLIHNQLCTTTYMFY